MYSNAWQLAISNDSAATIGNAAWAKGCALHSASKLTNPNERDNQKDNFEQHNYHDHAGDPAPILCATQRGPAVNFPQKLYEMLEKVEQDGFSHIVSFQPHGRCFIVRNSDLFSAILPRYFGLSKFSSFQRQLNLYGFQRLTRGMDRGGYYHELFLKGKPGLISNIVRRKVKGTRVRARANPEQEPNFYSLPFVDSSSHSSNIIPNRNMSHTTTSSGSFLHDDLDPLPLSTEPDAACLLKFAGLFPIADSCPSKNEDWCQSLHQPESPSVDLATSDSFEGVDVADVLGLLTEIGP